LDEFGPYSALVSFDFTSQLILVTRALLQVCDWR